LRALRTSLASQWRLLGPFVIAGLAWFPTVGRPVRRPPIESAVLIVPALGAVALYALSYSESRYLAPFVTLLLLGVAPDAALRAPEQLGPRPIGYAFLGTV
jgi:hypothetical protein